ncbi:MAG: UbiD family decarboxylase [Ignavibacteriales bacterium]|nr:UbiD family decarboxylase [Ignavibacteriales bacterium]
MIFPAFGEFVRSLESSRDLHRVRVEVDPYLEITEIATRALKEGRSALFFEKVKGSSYPLVINAFASERRIEHALGRHPQQIGEELVSFVERVIPPKLNVLWNNRSMVKRLFSARARTSSGGAAQEVVEQPDLDRMPIQTCWPKDGGRFVTLGQVFTYDPMDGKRNVGIYRLHVYDSQTTGMHWQIQKGGGFHYHRAEKLGKDLEVAVVLGTDPALLLASVAALPEGMDEVQFASFLRGRPIPMVRGKKVTMLVPANAEFILEGVVPQRERRREGPFGDHFGHYSSAAPFPVFHSQTVTRRKFPVYPATVVGIPPMEDKFLGDATQYILGPLVRLIHREVKDVWAYYEAGFHNLLVVAVEERYKKEAMKAALGLLGTGQLSLTKCLVLVSGETDPRDWVSVLKEIRDNFDPHFDFVLLPKVPLDTLDFTSFQMELGSKMVIDATRKQRRSMIRDSKRSIGSLRSLDRRIVDANVVEDCLLVVSVRNEGKSVVEKLVLQKELQHLKIIAVVSEDVDIRNQESYIWGIFTRFDCERDVVFSEQKLIGISPIYRGVMGIDATWKKGYPLPLKMDTKVVKKVEERWEHYWV